MKKTAITLPEALRQELDALATAHGESRSSFIRRVLQAAVLAERDADVTRQLNAVFAGEEVAAEQVCVAAEMDRAGTDWTEDGW